MRAQGLQSKTLFLIPMPVKRAAKRELTEVRNACWEKGRENRKQREREKTEKQRNKMALEAMTFSSERRIKFPI